MFEPELKNYILSDVLKIGIMDVLKSNNCKIPVMSGLNMELGECIKNSIAVNKESVAIVIAVNEGESTINTIDMLIHAINISEGVYVDNTDIERYEYYVIYEGSFATEDTLRSKMLKLLDEYVFKGSERLMNIYRESLESIDGCFNIKL